MAVALTYVSLWMDSYLLHALFLDIMGRKQCCFRCVPASHAVALVIDSATLTPLLHHSSGCSRCAGEEEALQYELYVARGWQRMRRQAGSVFVARKPGAFATVAISMRATAVGTIATPTLVVLPAQQPPVRAEPVLLQVVE